MHIFVTIPFNIFKVYYFVTVDNPPPMLTKFCWLRN